MISARLMSSRSRSVLPFTLRQWSPPFGMVNPNDAPEMSPLLTSSRTSFPTVVFGTSRAKRRPSASSASASVLDLVRPNRNCWVWSYSALNVLAPSQRASESARLHILGEVLDRGRGVELHHVALQTPTIRRLESQSPPFH